MKYNRILLKLSGQALMGNGSEPFDPDRLNQYAQDIKALAEKGIEIAIVIGGGNIFRGLKGKEKGVDRINGDYMGMLATLINSIAFQDALEKTGIDSTILSGIAVDPIAEKMSSKRAISLLTKNQIVLISGGTGNPFFTTDSAAVLRALEIKADVYLKGTRVDGVYSANPEKHPDAVKYDRISYDEAYEKKLKIMDLTAFTMCKENRLPVLVFNMNIPGNLQKILMNEQVGTFIGVD